MCRNTHIKIDIFDQKNGLLEIHMLHELTEKYILQSLSHIQIQKKYKPNYPKKVSHLHIKEFKIIELKHVL